MSQVSDPQPTPAPTPTPAPAPTPTPTPADGTPPTTSPTTAPATEQSATAITSDPSKLDKIKDAEKRVESKVYGLDLQHRCKQK